MSVATTPTAKHYIPEDTDLKFMNLTQSWHQQRSHYVYSKVQISMSMPIWSPDRESNHDCL